jgi:hypothetical protein
MSKIIDVMVQNTTGKSLDGNTCKILRSYCVKGSGNPDDRLWSDINSILLPNDEVRVTVKQIKSVLKNLGSNISGVKQELLARLKSRTILHCNALLIQRKYRGWIVTRVYKLFSSYESKRSTCVNDTDFYNLDKLTDIPKFKFMSITDEDNHTYGFSVNSLYTLSHQPPMKNPYTRQPIPEVVSKHLKWIYTINHFKNMNEDIDALESKMNIHEVFNLRVVSLFQYINQLGNYSNPSWFLELSIPDIRKFYRGLRDIWYHRAGLTWSIRRDICPLVDPFTILTSDYPVYTATDLISAELYYKIKVVQVMELMVYPGIDTDSKTLGALYILTALTLVSDTAALAFPWLYQSVYEGNI